MSFAGGAEIAFIALLAFVIVGPKDFPKLLFTLGRFLRTLQTLAQQFTAEFEAIQLPARNLLKNRGYHAKVLV